MAYHSSHDTTYESMGEEPQAERLQTGRDLSQRRSNPVAALEPEPEYQRALQLQQQPAPQPPNIERGVGSAQDNEGGDDGRARFFVGQAVQIYSNGQNQWCPGEVQSVAWVGQACDLVVKYTSVDGRDLRKRIHPQEGVNIYTAEPELEPEYLSESVDSESVDSESVDSSDQDQDLGWSSTSMRESGYIQA
jgi:hypothetical protein